MVIALKIVFHEATLAETLNVLARHNARIIELNPDLPLLYNMRARYTRERKEAWLDIMHIAKRRKEDCDGLAAARAGELIARGHEALSPVDPGYKWAKKHKLSSIPAEVMLLTNSVPGQPGLYHCIVRYCVNGRWYRDDPSARLGM